MNKYQKKLNSLISCMPDIIPYGRRKKIAKEAINLPINDIFRLIVKHTRKYIWNLVEDKRIRHWVHTYPHEIISSAIIDKNNTLHYWKTGDHSFEDCFIHEGYQVKVKIWCVYNDSEHEEVFTKLSEQWFRQFRVKEGYKGFLPY